MRQLGSYLPKKLPKIHFGLPLLQRELIEQANRPRTYFVRVAYAIILFLIASSVATSFYASVNKDPLGMLGQGQQMFLFITILQFIALYLLVPAMSAGAITSEKEKKTIELLLISRLGPWTIIFEKLMARLIPVGMCLLVAMPLMAVLFSVGGMSMSMIFSATYLLFVTAVQCASVAIMCSAICRTTTSAYIWTMIVCFLWILGMPTAHLIVFEMIGNLGTTGSNSTLLAVVYAFFTPYIMMTYAFTSGIESALWRSIPILIVSGFWLCIARMMLRHRALIHHATLATRMSRALRDVRDDVVQPRHSAADISPRPKRPTRLTGEMPRNHPIAWRQSRMLLGNRKFALTSGCLLTIGAWMWCLCAMIAGEDWSGVLTTLPLILLLLFTCLTACARSSGVLSGERDHQTLDVLLSTPLTTREIILQKQAAVRRMSLSLAMPMIVIIVCVGLSPNYSSGRREFDRLLYMTTAACAVLVYPAVCSWISFAVALRRKDQTGSIIASVILTAAWALLPLVGYMILYLFTWADSTDLFFPTIQLSPVVLMAINETNEWREFDAPVWFTVACHFGLQIFAIAYFRWWSLKSASRLLNRGETRANAKRNRNAPSDQA